MLPSTHTGKWWNPVSFCHTAYTPTQWATKPLSRLSVNFACKWDCHKRIGRETGELCVYSFGQLSDMGVKAKHKQSLTNIYPHSYIHTQYGAVYISAFNTKWMIFQSARAVASILPNRRHCIPCNQFANTHTLSRTFILTHSASHSRGGHLFIRLFRSSLREYRWIALCVS